MSHSSHDSLGLRPTVNMTEAVWLIWKTHLQPNLYGVGGFPLKSNMGVLCTERGIHYPLC